VAFFYKGRWKKRAVVPIVAVYTEKKAFAIAIESAADRSVIVKPVIHSESRTIEGDPA
jgi:hypothetical protein